MANLPPLSLYIHIPWCVQKCPYCDFNSHALKGEVPHDDYVAHLLADLDADVAYAQGREVKTIFIGGGTPSLLSGPAMQTLRCKPTPPSPATDTALRHPSTCLAGQSDAR